MSNAPGSSSRQHHQDLPVELNDSSPEQTTRRRATHERQERWSRLAQPESENTLELEQEESGQQHSRRIQERWNRLKESELTLDPKLEKLQSEISQLYELKDGLVEKCRELDYGIEETRKRLEKRKARRRNLKKITGELAVAQRFLSTADSLSQAEVVRDMEALNEEIFQLAAIAADKVQIHEQHFPTDEESAGYRKQIGLWVLGPAFMELVVPKKLQDVLAIQMGWQAILTYWCSRIIRAWNIEDRYVDQDIDYMYRRMRSQSHQAVAGRWRSLTLGSTDDPSPETREEITDNVIEAAIALPALCGYISDDESYDELFDVFCQRITPLLDKCLKFRRTVKGGVVSKEVGPFFIESGETHNPLHADLEYEDKKEDEPKNKRGIVACSLGMGLYCVRTSRAADGKVVRTREVILKAKAILQETLREIIT